jgi:membrane protein required for colicin V production
MNFVDILTAISLILFALLGFKDGFMRKLFGILTFFIAFIAATKLMNPVGDWIIDWFEFAPFFSYLFGFFISFLIVIFLINMLFRLLGPKATVLSIFNRMSGALLGAAQGLLIASLILIILKFADIPSEQSKRESVFYHDIIEIAPKVFDSVLTVVPDSKTLFEEIEKNLDRYKKKDKEKQTK